MSSERKLSNSSVRSMELNKSHSKGDEMFYKECESTYLSLYKSTSDRILSHNQLYTLLTRAGRSPSKHSMSKHWGKDTEYLTYVNFCNIMRKEKALEKTEVIGLFHSFDHSDSGTISKQVLEHILSSNGEPFSPSELNDIFAQFEDCVRSDGSFDYTKMSSKIMQTASDCVESHKITKNVPVRPTSSKVKLSEAKSEELKKKIFPKGSHKWTEKTLSGFLRYDNKVQQETAFKLKVKSSTSVIISAEPRNIVHFPKKDVEVLLICVKLGAPGKSLADSETVLLSDLSDGQKFYLKSDLGPGDYLVIPFTMTSKFLPRKSQPKSLGFIQLGKKDELTEECENAIEALFELIDVDGDGSISRNEMDLFQICCSGSKVEDEDWKQITENFDTVDDCITLEGFKTSHRMEALEEPGSLWTDLAKMGFNDALQLDDCCPIKIQLSSEKETIFEIDMDSVSLKQVEKLLCNMCDKASSSKAKLKTKTIDDLKVTTFKQSQLGIVCVSNTGKDSRKIKLDFSKSSNVDLQSEFNVETIQPNSSKVVKTLLPIDASKELVIKMAVELL